METFSTLLTLCVGNSPVNGEFPAQRPVMRSFDVFFDLRLNKRLSTQWWGWWFEMPWCSLWHHFNATSEVWDEMSFIHSPTSMVVWSLGMDKLFNLTHYNGCNYLSMLGLNIIHVSNRGLWLYSLDLVNSLTPGRCGSNLKKYKSQIYHTELALRWMPQNFANEKSMLFQVLRQQAITSLAKDVNASRT